jgi:hypothetical protein
MASHLLKYVKLIRDLLQKMGLKRVEKIRQDNRTRQNSQREAKTRQDKTIHEKRRQDNTRQHQKIKERKQAEADRRKTIPELVGRLGVRCDQRRT